ncbi:Protein Ycf2, partial [Bienertia sinuspersici]
FLDNKSKGSLIDASDDIDASGDIDCDLDTELELLTTMNALTMDMIRSRSLVSTGPDEKNGITSYGLVEDDSYLVHGLLEVEGAWWDPHGQKKIAVRMIE